MEELKTNQKRQREQDEAAANKKYQKNDKNSFLLFIHIYIHSSLYVN